MDQQTHCSTCHAHKQQVLLYTTLPAPTNYWQACSICLVACWCSVRLLLMHITRGNWDLIWQQADSMAPTVAHTVCTT
jgi:hypothetical protein